jgi:anti-sigma factor RsiW
VLRPANDDLRSERLSHITENDLRAYVAGALSAERRTAVEGFLACNPDLAARVMAELHRGRPAVRPRRWPGRAGAVAALCAAVVCTVWGLAVRHAADGWWEADGGPPPSYLEDAAEARQAADLRARMASQPQTPRVDAGEVRQVMDLPLPELPRDWRVMDAQVFPTDEGPALALALERPDRTRLDLFVVRAAGDDVDPPELALRGREAAAFWENGPAAYVLGGSVPRETLLSLARTLAGADRQS